MVKRNSHFKARAHVAAANTGELTQINFCQAAGRCKPPPPATAPLSGGFGVAEDVEAS